MSTSCSGELKTAGSSAYNIQNDQLTNQELDSQDNDDKNKTTDKLSERNRQTDTNEVRAQNKDRQRDRLTEREPNRDRKNKNSMSKAEMDRKM